MQPISNNSVNMVDDVFNLMIDDEYLLRLLYYEPNSRKIKTPLLPENNLIAPPPPFPTEEPSEAYLKMWDIIDRHILTTAKSDDLETNRLCRVYLYLGRQRPVLHNRLVRKQELVFDVFVHHTYEEDQRLDRIINRIIDLVDNKHVTGIGRCVLRSSYDFSAPNEYVAYRIVYEVGRSR